MKPTLELKSGMRRFFGRLLVLYAVAAFAWLALLGTLHALQTERTARSLTILTRDDLLIRNLRSVIVELSHFSPAPFSAIEFRDADRHTIFLVPEQASSPQATLFSGALEFDLLSQGDHGERLGSLVFAYPRFAGFDGGVLVLLLLLLASLPFVARFRKNLIEEHTEALRTRENEVMVRLAAQVSHDIRSPLAVLNLVADQARGIDAESREQLRGAITRVRDIANTLLQTEKLARADDRGGTFAAPELERSVARAPTGVEHLPGILASVVAEKRLEFAERGELRILDRLPFAFDAFAEINAVELRRALSNLLNNSVDALAGQVGKPGTIEVACGVENRDGRDSVVISVRDNGRGMSPSVQARLGERGFSTKSNDTDAGFGLGVYQAKNAVEAAAGRLEYHSTEGQGTEARLILPKAMLPAPLTSEISWTSGTQVIVLDDRDEPYEQWSRRFAAVDAGVPLRRFARSSDFQRWFLSEFETASPSLFLVDYDLGPGQLTGLDLIERLDLARDAVLVTDRWQDPEVRRRCLQLRLRLLPKEEIARVRFVGRLTVA